MGTEPGRTCSSKGGLLTIDEKIVTVQGIGAQPGDAIGLFAKLPVNLLWVQPRVHGAFMIGTQDIHSSAFLPILRRSGERHIDRESETPLR